MSETIITAKDISNLLVERHGDKFVCIPECKTGSSWLNAKCPRIDLWCIAKSWSKPRTIAYEIKVSRSDFLQDHKWRSYLPFCSEFYFATTWGLIDPSELPDEAGLVVMSKNLTRVYTKKKAPARDVQIPDSIYRYILMWRARITRERPKQTRAEYWANWLNEKEKNRLIGRGVSERLSRIVREKIDDVESENNRLKREIKRLEDAKGFLNEIGVNLHRYNVKGEILDAIATAQAGIPKKLENLIYRAFESISCAKTAIDTIQGRR